MKTLILYYSISGHTKRIAQLMQQSIGGDMEEIHTVNAYPDDFNDLVDQGKDEIDNGYLPELLPLTADLTQYDRIILGSPVWWYTYVPAVSTFLHENDLSGKKAALFATNEGWLGHTLSDFKAACKGAVVLDGLDVLFKGDTLKTSEKKIADWAKQTLQG